MIRISIDLQEDEREALITVASDEKRHPRQQAAMLIRRQLELMGVLKSQAAKSLSLEAEAHPAKAEAVGQ